jgi:hypothetical protein
VNLGYFEDRDQDKIIQTHEGTHQTSETIVDQVRDKNILVPIRQVA